MGNLTSNIEEGVKKLGRSVKRRYLQSFRIAVLDGYRSQGSASGRASIKILEKL